MTTLERVRSGQLLLVAQVIEQQGGMSGMRLIMVAPEDIPAIHPSARTPAITSSLIYLLLTKESSGDDDDEIANETMVPTQRGGLEPDEAITFLEMSLEKLKEAWPREYQYASSVIKDRTSAYIGVCPAHVYGSFDVSPELFPKGFGGNVTRTPSPVSGWSRDPGEMSSSEMMDASPLLEGAVVSFIDFEVPVFYDGL